MSTRAVIRECIFYDGCCVYEPSCTITNSCSHDGRHEGAEQRMRERDEQSARYEAQRLLYLQQHPPPPGFFARLRARIFGAGVKVE